MPRTSQQIRDEIESAKIATRNAKTSLSMYRVDRESADRGMCDSERQIDRHTSIMLILKQALPKAVARERAAAKRAREAEKKSAARRTREAEKQAAKAAPKKPSK